MPAVQVLSFDAAMRKIAGVSKRHLLLGNGFSIALKPDIFSYGTLYENTDFSAAPLIPPLFSTLATQDFELVIRHLLDAAKVLSIYEPTLDALAAKLRRDAGLVKDALVSTIAKHHPDRPFDITKSQYAACRAFLRLFDHIFTLNYDVLLYWALMQDEADDLSLRPDDGFRHPESGRELPYVSWQQTHSATVQYLHGALHLFDQGTEIIKYTWSKTDIAIVDQIRQALDEDKYPLFVAEGTTESKMERILHNAYLHRALRSFESCCTPSKNAIVIFGHSLADNDRHILRCISAGAASHLLVGLHGPADSASNKAAISAAHHLVAVRHQQRKNSPLNITFYDAATAKVWG
jgi:hypothetical protein